MNDHFAILDMAQLYCPECGINYAVPKHYLDSHAKREKPIYCPNGDQTTYAYPKAVEVAKPAIIPEQQLVKKEHNKISFQSEQTVSHLKTVFKSEGVRVPNSGNCPECGDYFKNLSAHILKDHL